MAPMLHASRGELACTLYSQPPLWSPAAQTVYGQQYGVQSTAAQTAYSQQYGVQSPSAQTECSLTAYSQQYGVQSPSVQSDCSQQYGLHSPADQTAYHKISQDQTSWSSTNPAVAVMPTADPVGYWYSQQNPWSNLAAPPQQQQSSLVPTSPATMPAPAVRDCPLPGKMAQPQHAVQPQTYQPVSAGQQVYHQQAVDPLPHLPASQPDAAPLPKLMHPASSPACRSSRSTRVVTSRFNDYTPSAEFDVSSLPTSCDQYLGGAQVMGAMLTQQPVSHAVQSLSGTSQQYARQSHSALVPYHSNSPNPYHAYIDQYSQLYASQHMTQIISPDENSVFVPDGHSWKEYNLEKVFSR